MHNFKDLLVWQKAVELAVVIYQKLEDFPTREKFNLISQMQRAATSIPSNIAEGCGRSSNPAFKQFLAIALGSSYELETQIILSSRLKYLDDEESNFLLKKIVEVQRMLNGLHASLH